MNACKKVRFTGPFYFIIIRHISNSLKYSRKEADPTIIVKSNITNNQIELSFSDNGIGIDMNRHGNELFGLYKRFNDTEEGKGMGLFMVKSQIHAIGGQIAIQSELNKGTLFKITLPLA